MREGERDETSPTCFTSLWRPGSFEGCLADAEFVVEASGRYVDRAGDVWRTALARRAPAPM